MQAMRTQYCACGGEVAPTADKGAAAGARTETTDMAATTEDGAIRDDLDTMLAMRGLVATEDMVDQPRPTAAKTMDTGKQIRRKPPELRLHLVHLPAAKTNQEGKSWTTEGAVAETLIEAVGTATVAVTAVGGVGTVGTRAVAARVRPRRGTVARRAPQQHHTGMAIPLGKSGIRRHHQQLLVPSLRTSSNAVQEDNTAAGILQAGDEDDNEDLNPERCHLTRTFGSTLRSPQIG